MSEDYMDEILMRKAFKELDDPLRVEIVTAFWGELKRSLELAVEQWNAKCQVYDAANTRIIFYPNPFITENGSLAGLTGEEELKSTVDLGGAPMWSVCAETVKKGVSGGPNARLYVWLTQVEPYRIQFSYGKSPNYTAASEVALRVEGGAILFDNGESEPDFLLRTTRSLLVPLMEAA